MTDLADIRENIKIADEFIDRKSKELSMLKETIQSSKRVLSWMEEQLSYNKNHKNYDKLVHICDNVKEVYIAPLEESSNIIVRQITAAEELRSASYGALSDYEFAMIAGNQMRNSAGGDLDIEHKLREMQKASYTFQELAKLRA